MNVGSTLNRVAEIDREFEQAFGLSPRLIALSEERERLVESLIAEGYMLGHRWRYSVPVR